MNITKNGIFLENRPRQHSAKVMQFKPFHYKSFVTLTRIEEGHVVWLSMPFFKEEVRQLKKEGWRIAEVWKPETQ